MQLKIFIEKSIPFVSVYGLKESMESIGLSYKIYEVEKINVLKLKEPILIYSKKNNYNKLKKLNLSFVYVPFEEDDVKLKKDLKNIKDIDNIKSFFVKDNHFSSFKKIFVLIDIFSIIGVFLSGNFKESINPLLMRMPFINSINENIENSLTEIYSVYGLPFITKYFWPNSYKGALVLTHDIDYVDFPFLYLLSLMKRAIITGKNFNKWIISLIRFIKNRLFIKNQDFFVKFKNLKDYINLEKKFNTKSSFYFLGGDSVYNIKLYSKEIKRLYEEGFDICLHSNMNRANLSLVEDEKKLFQENLQIKSKGIRKHTFNSSFPEDWINYKKAGFFYDSSFAFSTIVGSRAGYFLPYFTADLKRKKRLNLIELPPNIMDTTLFHRKYMDLDSEKAFAKSKRLIDEILNYNGMCVLLWHNQSLDEAKDETMVYTYKILLTYAHKKYLWITNSRQISEWWVKRSKINIKFNKNKHTLLINSPFDIKDFTVRTSLFDKGIINESLVNYNLVKGKNKFILKC